MKPCIICHMEMLPIGDYYKKLAFFCVSCKVKIPSLFGEEKQQLRELVEKRKIMKLEQEKEDIEIERKEKLLENMK
ncbi:hypothetical protein PR048_008375, partial [Dryococelus australis]